MGGKNRESSQLPFSTGIWELGIRECSSFMAKFLLGMRLGASQSCRCPRMGWEFQLGTQEYPGAVPGFWEQSKNPRILDWFGQEGILSHFNIPGCSNPALNIPGMWEPQLPWELCQRLPSLLGKTPFIRFLRILFPPNPSSFPIQGKFQAQGRSCRISRELRIPRDRLEQPPD